MRWGWSGLLPIVLSTTALCVDQPTELALLPCPQALADTSDCNPSKQDLKLARAAFAKGLKLQRRGRTDAAFAQFESAARLAPRNVDYLTAREMARQQLVFDHLQQGNTALLAKRPIEAMARFRHAVELDPNNQFAQQRLQDAVADWGPKNTLGARMLESGGEVRVNPSDAQVDFHYR
ncbi:MAG TPA: hypothetical protein VH744_08040, partial [Terriglobales bacterium]